MKRIALIADYDLNSETHLATEQAISHSADHLGICAKADWVSTDKISPNIFQDFDGIWIGTGSPYRNIKNVFFAIEYARKNDFPIFATCGGFQHMILEIGRNELNFPKAAHAEYDKISKILATLLS